MAERHEVGAADLHHKWVETDDMKDLKGYRSVPSGRIAPTPGPPGSPGPSGFWGRLAREQDGTTTLEWALLLAAIAIPSYVIIVMALETLLGHYRMMTTLNSLPFP